MLVFAQHTIRVTYVSEISGEHWTKTYLRLSRGDGHYSTPARQITHYQVCKSISCKLVQFRDLGKMTLNLPKRIRGLRALFNDLCTKRGQCHHFGPCQL